MNPNQTFNNSIQYIRISEQELLDILCDYFLEDNHPNYNEWHARLVNSPTGIEFIAVFGHTDDFNFQSIVAKDFKPQSDKEKADSKV